VPAAGLNNRLSEVVGQNMTSSNPNQFFEYTNTDEEARPSIGNDFISGENDHGDG